MHLTPSAWQSSKLSILSSIFQTAYPVWGDRGQHWANGHTGMYSNTKTHSANESISGRKRDQHTLNITDGHNPNLFWLRDYQKARDWVDMHSRASTALHNLYIPLSISDPTISHLTAF